MAVIEVGRRPALAPAFRAALPSVLEIGGLVLMAAAYTWIRAQQGADAGVAYAHAEVILGHERWLFDHLELPFNHWVAATAVVAIPASYFYAVFHYLMTPLVFAVSWKRGGWIYKRGYWTLVIASGLALILYATYSAAPPRLLPGSGAIDVLRQYAAYGWWGDAASAPRAIGDATNQFAAMPSLHFGWSLWCAIQMWSFGGRGWRIAAVAYPTIQAVVVIGTANHFIGDVVVGGLCVLLAEGIVVLVHRGRRRIGSRLVLGSPAP